jgi:hypothetical protein
MTAELIEVIRYTAFAIVIAFVIGLGTVKAASISGKDYPRRSHDAAVRRGAGSQTRGAEARIVDMPTEEPSHVGNVRVGDGAHVHRSRSGVTS